MIESLIITLREGVEIALIIGLLVVYLTKIGQPVLKRSVYLALGAAMAMSSVSVVSNALRLGHWRPARKEQKS